MLGKKKCKMLREIRQRIANENEIPYVTEDCKYKGDCKGTCPKCEAELRYLEAQLEKRRSLGKKVTVSALALGMVATGFSGCGQTLAGMPEPLEGDVPYVETDPSAGDDVLAGKLLPEDDTGGTDRTEGEVPETEAPSGDETEFELAGDVIYEPGSGCETG